ncbi:hypothetical protein LOTGIDRAFT_156565 [Lottia gigantea]|uniref:Zinc finger CHCC-type domain-containing protein n=1 Tax=Lottia gigantea TaxID=225164 RepID=V4B113_LOTGI|nr:hypothetical protein LOTGIDRAFT_156565 [Lottia gigantea]ESP03963.1 hypothetical protein LOTGIDRAFT_156565 [Lottia gigantea]
MAALTRVCSRVCKQNVIVRALSTSSKVCSAEENVGKQTHTGQVFDKDDYRRVRFVGKDKLVNPQWAINLIAEDPIVVCDTNHVWSDSGGPLGHPKVYLNLDPPEVQVCGYSGRKFILKKYYDKTKHGDSISYDEYLKQVRAKYSSQNKV